jgi:hypothetical protein
MCLGIQSKTLSVVMDAFGGNVCVLTFPSSKRGLYGKLKYKDVLSAPGLMKPMRHFIAVPPSTVGGRVSTFAT